MTALAKMPAPTPAKLANARESAAATVAALERLERDSRDPHITALLVGARQLLGAVEVEIERCGGGSSRALVHVSAATATASECIRLTVACEQLAVAVARRGGPGAAAVHFAVRRLVVAVEQIEQRDRRLGAEVLRVPALPAPAAIATHSTTTTTETES